MFLCFTDADEQDINLSAIATASPLSGSCHGDHGLTPMLGSLLENLQLKAPFLYIYKLPWLPCLFTAIEECN